MKTALVTGSNRGIGKALVEELVAKGYFVFAGMRDVTHSPFDSKSIMPVSLDVLDDTSAEKAAKVVAQKGPLQILVNNAGTNLDTTANGKQEHLTVLDAISREAMLKMFDINSVSPLMMAKYFVPLMTDADSFIINISSDRASFGDRDTPNAYYGYRSSKVALNMITECLVFDLPKNVSTLAVHPGRVKTDLNPLGVTTPSDSAKQIIHILDIWDPSMNGVFLNTDGSAFPR